MKNLEDIINKLSADRVQELSSRLGARGLTGSKIVSAIVNVCHFHSLINTLSPPELKLLKHIYSGHDGITLGELQKETAIELTDIENSISNLSNLLLVYVIKNRQLLNKRMDKIYCITEIFEFFKVSEISRLKSHMENITEALLQHHETSHDKKEIKYHEVLNFIASNGNLVNIEQLLDSDIKGADKVITEFQQKGMIKIHYVVSEKLNTLLSINQSEVLKVVLSLKKNELKKTSTSSNGFNSLINALHTYDIVSSSGIFLTKQDHFRKIDIKKIADYMMELTDSSGNPIDEETAAFFSMQILNILHVLWLEKDIGTVSLKNISGHIEDPVLLIKQLFSSISELKGRDEHFDNTVRIPGTESLKILLKTAEKLKISGYSQLHAAYTASSILSNISGGTSGSDIEELNRNFHEALTFLTILGLIDIEKGKFLITTQGEELIHLLRGKKKKLESTEKKKCIIINPDFNLMIDEREIDPRDLYVIQAFTDIVNRDTILQCAITKSSVINANKRGMDIEQFIDRLKTYAKNELPQNLEFLLEDWTNQTIRIDISKSILVYTSHSSFIDELSYSSLAKIIKKRIADNYMLIDKESIDDLVKFSKKFDVVLNVFEKND